MTLPTTISIHHHHHHGPMSLLDKLCLYRDSFYPKDHDGVRKGTRTFSICMMIYCFMVSTVMILLLALHFMVINDVTVITNYLSNGDILDSSDDNVDFYDVQTLDEFKKRFITFLKLQSTLFTFLNFIFLGIFTIFFYLSYRLRKSTYVKNVRDILRWLNFSTVLTTVITVFAFFYALEKSMYLLAFDAFMVFVLFTLYRGTVLSFYGYEYQLDIANKKKFQKKEHICDNSSTSHLLEGF